jgi:hypothetical protein
MPATRTCVLPSACAKSPAEAADPSRNVTRVGSTPAGLEDRREGDIKVLAAGEAEVLGQHRSRRPWPWW